MKNCCISKCLNNVKAFYQKAKESCPYVLSFKSDNTVGLENSDKLQKLSLDFKVNAVDILIVLVAVINAILVASAFAKLMFHINYKRR